MSKAEKKIITGAQQALGYLKGDETKGRAYRKIDRKKEGVKSTIDNTIWITKEIGSDRSFMHTTQCKTPNLIYQKCPYILIKSVGLLCFRGKLTIVSLTPLFVPI